ncbi:unnamed protein product [Phytophthora fragariaefolia]|uniref:Unnamed protein product n=1 Tax=Phytophthora fragariaefolia TaxID=1490495 RepID=A0A9W6YLB9_9STRA|nr:unnamed protein product [Phytophthora fragariaefolia]
MGVDATYANMLDTAVQIVNHCYPDQLTRSSGRQATVSCFDNDNKFNIDVAHQAGRSGIDLLASPLKPELGINTIPLKHNSVVPAEVTTSSPSDQLSNFVRGSAKAIEQLEICEKQLFVHETCRMLRRLEFVLLVEYTRVTATLVFRDGRPSENNSKPFGSLLIATALVCIVGDGGASTIPPSSGSNASICSENGMENCSRIIRTWDHLLAPVFYTTRWYVLYTLALQLQDYSRNYSTNLLSNAQDWITRSSFSGCTHTANDKYPE